METKKIGDFQRAKKRSFSSKIIGRGAEAVLIHKSDKLIKKRVPKTYRHPDLDKRIRIRRTRSEAKLLEKAGKIISSPKVIKVDEKSAEIDMEFIEGKKLSDNLDKFPLKEQLEISEKIGEEIALLHNQDIIHGDLTTSNMILSSDKIYFIDFGLGFHSNRIEDKAVDLHLLRQALESKHFEHWQNLFDSVLRGYKTKSKDADKILVQFKKVESRGRYKGKH
jgi:Kae1-associated kinase Bud32